MPKGRTAPRLTVATKPSPSRDHTLQQYLQLSTQKDSLNHRITLAAFSSAGSPESTSSPSDPFSLSPTNSPPQSSDRNASFSTYMATSQPVDTLPRTGAMPPSLPSSSYDSRRDEQLLADVQNQIKATLTELLNHESVRQDDGLRHWVQERLLEAELETRNQRRRSRRRSSIDRELVSVSIAEHIRGPSLFRLGTTL